MDALELAITALRLGLVLLLYAFLVVVLRASQRMLTAPDGPTGARVEAEVFRPNGRPSGKLLRCLVVEPGTTGLRTGEYLDIAAGATVGRGATSDLVLADPTISSGHARFARDRRGWSLVDLGSTNGSTVNGQVVREQAALAQGDLVTLGQVQIKVVSE